MDEIKQIPVINEKAMNKEDGAESGAESISADQVQELDAKATKRLLRKIDIHVLPMMCLICLLCFLDRSNIGNARLDSLESDLHLTGLQYNDCLAILFPFYIAAEIPSNIMMKRIRPATWLSLTMLLWSICTIGQSFVASYPSLLTTRALLGLFEGGFFPGANFYVTQWYRRDECGLRMAVIFSCATIAGAFGGVLARGIAEMSGMGGLAAWSWIFLIEGLASVVVAVGAFWGVCDYPASATFLTPLERNAVQHRLATDTGSLSSSPSSSSPFSTKPILLALRDWKIYIHMLICMAGFCPVYSFSLFLPTIIRNMGYSANTAQLMSAPPYVLACAFTVGASALADRCRRRGVFLLGFQGVAMTGFVVLLAAGGRPGVQYVGTVLAAIGIYPQIPLGLAWNSNNIGGSLKRATGIAMQVMGGNCGGIVASYVYLSRDEPRFVVGHSILIGFIGMAFVLTLFMTTWCRRENIRRDAAAEGEAMANELTAEQKELEQELADDNPWFRYTI